MTILAVLTVRNEGAFLIEWLAHHRACGFDDFLVFSNDCADGTDQMLDRLEQMGWLTHLRNDGPYDAQGIQFTALNTAARHKSVRKARWLMVLDIDEFVNIHCGAHRLEDLLAALPQADAIALTWKLFGNAGVLRWEDRPVTEIFSRAAPSDIGWPWRASMFKTLYRNNGRYRKPGVHRPRAPVEGKAERARWFDGSGRRLDARFATQRIFTDFDRSAHDLVQLNHYALGAMESFLIKAARGRVNRSADPIGMDYWCERNFCEVEDRSILSLAPARREITAELMADRKLARLHAGAVDWRRGEIARLLENEQMRALMGRLLLTPPSRPLRGADQRYILEAAQRASGNKA